jgi:uncharacterized lipoprotein YmbA
MNSSSRLFVLLLLSGAACFSGCLNLKPAAPAPRYFVLSAVPEEGEISRRTGSEALQAVGVGPVKLPGYLARKSLAIRKGANEIEYLQSAHWAENLEQGFGRVFAADLAARLLGKQIRRAWRSDEVALEIHITVERFDVDAAGQGALVAGYRILARGKGQVLKAEQFRAGRPGPRPESDPKGATATLSSLVDDLCGELAKVVEKTTERK